MESKKVFKATDDLKYVLFRNGKVGISAGEVANIFNTFTKPIEGDKSEEARIIRDDIDNFVSDMMGQDKWKCLAKCPNGKSVVCYPSVFVVGTMEQIYKTIGRKLLDGKRAERDVLSKLVQSVLEFLFTLSVYGLDNMAGSAVIQDNLDEGDD